MQVYFFPRNAVALSDAPWAFFGLAVCGLITSFTSTLMFTALGSFFNRISDPDMGGAYLTLLNTIANMGMVLAFLWLSFPCAACCLSGCPAALSSHSLQLASCSSCTSAPARMEII